MKKPETIKAITKLANKYGFKLIRQKKHLVFRNHQGLQFVTSSSSSDYRFLRNAESTLKKLVQNHGNSDHTN